MTNLENLEVDQSLQSGMQLVCNYLHLLDIGGILKVDIDFETGAGMTMLNKSQCYKLIHKYFLAKNPHATFR